MVRSYARRYTFSQADHDATSERLARLERLMKQASAAGFGPGGVLEGGRGGGRITCSEELLAAAERCSAKLAAYYEMEGQREGWEAQLDGLAARLRSLALLLTARRRAAAAALRASVESCLRELAMGGSRFDVRIGWAEERAAAGGAEEGLYIGEEEAEEAGVAELGGGTYVMGPSGLDQVEFLLAAGPAEPLRPLAAVASGGESARVMLALKAAPAAAAAAAAAGLTAGGDAAAGAGADGASGSSGSGVPIMILDELDSGIGSRLGSAVGSILARMAAPGGAAGGGSVSQILCVTHLPQVACYAAHHIKVQKELSGADGGAAGAAAGARGGAGGGRVTTAFRPLLTAAERCEEVAAMLGLDTGVAGEMLRTAQHQVAALYPPGCVPEALLAAAAAAPGGGGGGPQGSDLQRAIRTSQRSDTTTTAAADGVVAAPFNIVVAPTMEPNAVLAATAAAASGDGGGGGDSEAEETELRAALMAGVEAAALEHLARMQAQAAAAAEAAAAAAALVVGKDAAGAPAAAVPAADPDPADLGTEDYVRVRVEGELSVGAEDACGEETPAAEAAATATGDAGGSETDPATALLVGLQSAAATASSTEDLAADALFEAAAAAAAAAGSPNEGAVEDVASAGYGVGYDADISSFAVAAQPTASPSPLPYTAAASASVSVDAADPPAAAAAAAAEASDPGGAAAEASYDPYEVEEPPQHADVPYDAPYTSASQAYGALNDGHTLHVGGSGGQFVAPPPASAPAASATGYRDMFATIASFSREEYAGEALKSCERTLWQALRDSGLA